MLECDDLPRILVHVMSKDLNETMESPRRLRYQSESDMISISSIRFTDAEFSRVPPHRGVDKMMLASAGSRDHVSKFWL